MLKLQGNDRGRDVVVRLREKESSFNKLFWIAFAIALSLHLAAVLIFQIQPFYIGSLARHPPVSVEMEISKSSALAEDVQKKEEEDDIGAPPFLPIYTPSIKSFQLQRNEEKFEDERNFFPLHHPPAPSPRVYAPIEIHFSGDLLSRQLVSHLVDEERQGFSLIYSQILRYHVRVYEPTGEIFWYERVSPPLRKEQNQTAEKLLKNLRFAANSKGLELEGEVSFIFNEEAKR